MRKIAARMLNDDLTEVSTETRSGCNVSNMQQIVENANAAKIVRFAMFHKVASL